MAMPLTLKATPTPKDSVFAQQASKQKKSCIYILKSAKLSFKEQTNQNLTSRKNFYFLGREE
jgi:hypothetical protein